MAEGRLYGSGAAQGYSSYQSGGSTEATDTGGEFIRLTRVINGNVHKITTNVTQMNQLIARIGTSADNPALRDKLHEVQHYTSQVSKETNQLVKDLTRMPVLGDQSQKRERKMQRDRLLNDFATVLNNFQSAQRQQKTREATMVTHTEPSAGNEGSGQLDDAFGQQRGQMMVEKGEDIDLDILRERDVAVQKLEADIVDINKIFKDLSLLVHEQGDVVDSIESSVESSAINVTRGLDELRQARDYQSKVRRRKLCIAIIVLVVVVILITIISVSLTRS